MIVEQVPGENFTIETFDGNIRTLQIESILHMEKQRTEADDIYSYEDMIFLKNGVIFSLSI